MGERRLSDMSWDCQAQPGNHALRGFRQRQRQRIRRGALDHGGRQHGQDERYEQIQLTLADHIVDQEFRRRRQHQSRRSADDDENQAKGEILAARLDELPDFLGDRAIGPAAPRTLWTATSEASRMAQKAPSSWRTAGAPKPAARAHRSSPPARLASGVWKA